MSVELLERVTEVPSDDGTPSWVHPGWSARFPWLMQATTHRGDADFDLRFFGGDRRRDAERRMAGVADAAGFRRQVLSHQVHDREVLCHRGSGKGLSIAADADGHITDEPDLLLAVTVADCVPVFVVDPEARAIALLHAGWRSAAAGILEVGLTRLRTEYGTRSQDVFLHLGPSICERCYEVGPEVFRALQQPEPQRPTPIDLRMVIARQAGELGVSQSRMSISAHCTLCGAGPFYSHRGGDLGRQLALLGIRDDDRLAAAGLCGACRYARRVEGRRGSVFLLCQRSRVDSEFKKYPRLPVIDCRGFEPVEGATL